MADSRFGRKKYCRNCRVPMRRNSICALCRQLMRLINEAHQMGRKAEDAGDRYFEKYAGRGRSLSRLEY